MDYQHWLREAIAQLQNSESPRRDAEILLETVTGKGVPLFWRLVKRY